MDTRMTVPVWTQIEEAVKDIPGWSPIDQLYTLFTLAYFIAPEGDFLEIGSWCGRSSVVLGTAAKLKGNKLFCLDLFPSKNDWMQNADGSYSFVTEINGTKYGGYQSQTVWQEPFEKSIAPLYEKRNSVMEYFDDSIKNNGLAECVSAHRSTSEYCYVLKAENKRISFAFIDGDHSYDAVVQDIRKVSEILLPGGVICFDDAFSHYEGVNDAIKEWIIDNPEYIAKKQMTRKLFVAQKGC